MRTYHVLMIGLALVSTALVVGQSVKANIGTTLSIQLISFKLSDYCLAGVFIGLMLHLISNNTKIKNGGLALLGFGIISRPVLCFRDNPYRNTMRSVVRLCK